MIPRLLILLGLLIGPCLAAGGAAAAPPSGPAARLIAALAASLPADARVRAAGAEGDPFAGAAAFTDLEITYPRGLAPQTGPLPVSPEAAAALRLMTVRVARAELGRVALRPDGRVARIGRGRFEGYEAAFVGGARQRMDRMTFEDAPPSVFGDTSEMFTAAPETLDAGPLRLEGYSMTDPARGLTNRIRSVSGAATRNGVSDGGLIEGLSAALPALDMTIDRLSFGRTDIRPARELFALMPKAEEADPTLTLRIMDVVARLIPDFELTGVTLRPRGPRPGEVRLGRAALDLPDAAGAGAFALDVEDLRLPPELAPGAVRRLARLGSGGDGLSLTAAGAVGRRPTPRRSTSTRSASSSATAAPWTCASAWAACPPPSRSDASQPTPRRAAARRGSRAGGWAR